MEVKRCLSCFPIGYSSLRRKTINSYVSNDTNLASAEASQVDLNFKKSQAYKQVRAFVVSVWHGVAFRRSP